MAPRQTQNRRALAEKKFHEISEAFEVLENSNKRKHYDDILRLELSLQDVNRTFDDVFGEHGIVDEEEEKFFKVHYP